MLKSLIEARTEEISEIRPTDPGYEKALNKSFKMHETLKKLIPQKYEEEINKWIDDYNLELDSISIFREREAYKQGLADGMELSKIILK